MNYSISSGSKILIWFDPLVKGRRKNEVINQSESFPLSVYSITNPDVTGADQGSEILVADDVLLPQMLLASLVWHWINVAADGNSLYPTPLLLPISIHFYGAAQILSLDDWK